MTWRECLRARGRVTWTQYPMSIIGIEVLWRMSSWLVNDLWTARAVPPLAWCREEL